jgi:hypothetical protein
MDPMTYHTTYEFLKQRTEKGFNIAVRPINTHDKGESKVKYMIN